MLPSPSFKIHLLDEIKVSAGDSSPVVQTPPVPGSSHGRPCVPSRQDPTHAQGPQAGWARGALEPREPEKSHVQIRPLSGGFPVFPTVSCDVTQFTGCLAAHRPGPLGLRPPRPPGTPGAPHSRQAHCSRPHLSAALGPPSHQDQHPLPPSRPQPPLPPTSGTHHPRAEIAVPSGGGRGAPRGPWGASHRRHGVSLSSKAAAQPGPGQLLKALRRPPSCPRHPVLRKPARSPGRAGDRRGTWILELSKQGHG